MASNRARRSVEDYLERASSLQQQGLFQKAISELEKAVKIAPEKPPVYKNLAELYRGQRQMSQAVTSIRKAITERPEDAHAREMLLEMLLELGRFDEVIEEARALMMVSPRSLAARDMLSVAYLQKGLLEKALQMTGELINLDPTSPINHFKKAVLYQQKGDVGGAIHEFSRVLDMQPDLDMAQEAQRAIENLDAYQLRRIVMLAVEDYIFRAKLIQDPESAVLERGYYLSGSGMAAVSQIRFDDLPEIYSEWKQRYYH